GLSADSEEKHEPVSDIDTAVMEGLKALDPNRPIREADMCGALAHVRFRPLADIQEFGSHQKKNPGTLPGLSY
ncbi:MAG: hypothetical protein ACM3IH_04705, partial [Sphingobacteriales bacterium]